MRPLVLLPGKRLFQVFSPLRAQGLRVQIMAREKAREVAMVQQAQQGSLVVQVHPRPH